ncbi:hypothetical protein H5410_064729 [Solanum commersonii]|uniref:Uncharacterized protein n=1 Tax=Solanum commersonii TaxID=4109 RepID=A0A9J5VYI3_SOLCO|nr:hypothetical protein H5410_064729 [Solanum commersonii]
MTDVVTNSRIFPYYAKLMGRFKITAYTTYFLIEPLYGPAQNHKNKNKIDPRLNIVRSNDKSYDISIRIFLRDPKWISTLMILDDGCTQLILVGFTSKKIYSK